MSPSAAASRPPPNSYRALQHASTVSIRATSPVPAGCQQGAVFAQKTMTRDCAGPRESPPPLTSSHPSNVLGVKAPMPPQTVDGSDAQYTAQPPTPTGTGSRMRASTSRFSFSSLHSSHMLKLFDTDLPHLHLASTRRGLYHHPLTPVPYLPVLDGFSELQPAPMVRANAPAGSPWLPLPLSCTPILQDGRALNVIDLPLPQLVRIFSMHQW